MKKESVPGQLFNYPHCNAGGGGAVAQRFSAKGPRLQLIQSGTRICVASDMKLFSISRFFEAHIIAHIEMQSKKYKE